MAGRDMIEVEDLIYHHETDDAILVQDGSDGVKVWLPKSQIEYPELPHVDDVIVVTMPEWLAEKKGLI